jgi:hypothetical protein
MMRLMRGRRLDRRLLGAVLAAALVPATVHGQQEACDETAGTLGIQGMRCEGCSFRMSESGLEEARFRTEPEVLALARGFTTGDRLRPGDRIVAIDGSLITTLEGSGKLVGLRASQPIRVRVRRDGGLVDLRIVPGSACELQRRPRGELEIERLEEVEVESMGIPPAPPTAATPGTAALPPLPPAPPARPLAPSGFLGFGLQCSECGLSGGLFYFETPPTVQGVMDGGPAQRAGLRSGDAIVAVDGLDITTPRGARRFSGIAPGDTVRLTVRRDAATREATLVAGERPQELSPLAPAALEDRLRYEGRVGDARIEVRGAPVRVTRDEEAGEVVIRTSDTVIIIRRGG